MAVRTQDPLPNKANCLVPVFLGESPNTLLSADFSTFGTIESRTGKIMQVLHSEEQLSIQLYCQMSMDCGPSYRRRKVAASGGMATLSAVIYGLPTAFEDVGNFIEECGMFLQDPLHCDRNVRYQNPHRLSGPEDKIVMTLPPVLDAICPKVEEIETPQDLFSGLGDSEVLLETAAPDEIKTSLHRSAACRSLALPLAR